MGLCECYWAPFKLSCILINYVISVTTLGWEGIMGRPPFLPAILAQQRAQREVVITITIACSCQILLQETPYLHVVTAVCGSVILCLQG